MTKPSRFAAAGLLLALPIGALYAAVVLGIGPLEAVLRSLLTDGGDQPNAAGRVYQMAGLLALPFALAATLWPVLGRGLRRASDHLHPMNIAVAIVVAWLIAVTWGGLAEDVYRCDVLRVPNCD